MVTTKPDVASPHGDGGLLERWVAGEEPAGRQLLTRHRAAVADSGSSPAFDSVDSSGRLALALVRSGAVTDLPFRVTWLAVHTQGALPADGAQDDPVWDAFRALPLAAQTALWHHEVEGQEVTAISHVLGTAPDVARDELAAAYAAVRTHIGLTPTLGSRASAAHLALLQSSLRDTLAGVVLGPAAATYLAARPRAGQRRVVIAPTPTRRSVSASGLAALTAVAVAVAAVASLPGLGQPGTPTAMAPFQAVAEPPLIGLELQPLPEVPALTPTVAPQPVLAPVGASTGSTTTSTAAPASAPGGGAGGAATGGKASGGKGKGGPSNGGAAPGNGPSGDGGGGTSGGGGGTSGGGSPAPAPTSNGPGQGVQHASAQGVSNGVRAHGNGNSNKGGQAGKSRGPSQSKSTGPGHSSVKSPGNSASKSHGKSPGKGKGKARGHR